MDLQIDVDEADVSLVSKGQSARFTVDVYPNRSFDAVITKVRFTPETTEGVATYKAHLFVDNSEGLLRPGMTATAEISARTVKDALLVPNEALRFVPPLPETDNERSGLLSRPHAGALCRRPVHRLHRLCLFGRDRYRLRILSGPTGGPAQPDRGSEA